MSKRVEGDLKTVADVLQDFDGPSVWEQAQQAAAKLAAAERAVRLLMTEVIESGNGTAKDFGWVAAIAAAHEVLGTAESPRSGGSEGL